MRMNYTYKWEGRRFEQYVSAEGVSDWLPTGCSVSVPIESLRHTWPICIVLNQEEFDADMRAMFPPKKWYEFWK